MIVRKLVTSSKKYDYLEDKSEIDKFIILHSAAGFGDNMHLTVSA